jgi:hypothetical protein
MTAAHKRQLFRIGLLVALGVPVVLGAWVIVSQVAGLDLVWTCQLAGLSSLVLLATSIVLPLCLRQPREARLRGFVVLWFTMSSAFNLVWELPRVIFKATLVGMEVSRANLPYGIAWWGYTLADSHYHLATPYMITFELWWLLANAAAIIGLWLVRRGSLTKGHLWLGVAGALQAYNASLYLVGTGVIDHLSNVGSGAMSSVLYWGFNLLWTGAGTLGSVVALRLVLAGNAQPAAQPEGEALEDAA